MIFSFHVGNTVEIGNAYIFCVCSAAVQMKYMIAHTATKSMFEIKRLRNCLGLPAESGREHTAAQHARLRHVMLR